MGRGADNKDAGGGKRQGDVDIAKERFERGRGGDANRPLESVADEGRRCVSTSQSTPAKRDFVVCGNGERAGGFLQRTEQQMVRVAL